MAELTGCEWEWRTVSVNFRKDREGTLIQSVVELLCDSVWGLELVHDDDDDDDGCGASWAACVWKLYHLPTKSWMGAKFSETDLDMMLTIVHALNNAANWENLTKIEDAPLYRSATRIALLEARSVDDVVIARKH